MAAENYNVVPSQTSIKVEGQNKITDMLGLDPHRHSLSRYTLLFLARRKMTLRK